MPNYRDDGELRLGLDPAEPRVQGAGAWPLLSMRFDRHFRFRGAFIGGALLLFITVGTLVVVGAVGSFGFNHHREFREICNVIVVVTLGLLAVEISYTIFKRMTCNRETVHMIDEWNLEHHAGTHHDVPPVPEQ